MEICINRSKLWKSLLTIWIIFNAITLVMLAWNYTHSELVGTIEDNNTKECFIDLFSQKQICWQGWGYFGIPLSLDIIGTIATYCIIWYYYNDKHKWIVLSWCKKQDSAEVVSE